MNPTEVPTLETIEIVRPVHKKWPISAEAGRVNPQYWDTFHKGTDFGTPIGQPVASVLDGTIQVCGFDKALGHRVWILTRHEKRGFIRCGYCHLSKIYVRQGQKLACGDHVGLTGNSGTRRDGSPNPAHLHFQIEEWPTRKILKPTFI